MDDDVIIIERSKLKSIFILIFSTAAVAYGVQLIAKGQAFGWILAIFCGLATITSIFSLLPGAFRLRVDRNGIEMKTMFKPVKLSWSDVESFYVATIPAGLAKTKMIGIEYSHTYKAMKLGRRISAG
jgi:hypothetical protein